MSTYIDDFNAPYGRMIMCHMMADTREELDAMADKIGVARKWIQLEGRFPHYDICLSKKNKAIALGAIELSARDLVKRFPPMPIRKCNKCGSDTPFDYCDSCVELHLSNSMY